MSDWLKDADVPEKQKVKPKPKAKAKPKKSTASDRAQAASNRSENFAMGLYKKR